MKPELNTWKQYMQRKTRQVNNGSLRVHFHSFLLKYLQLCKSGISLKLYKLTPTKLTHSGAQLRQEKGMDVL